MLNAMPAHIEGQAFKNPDIMSVFNNMEVSSNAMKSTMMVGIFVYAILCLGSCFLCLSSVHYEKYKKEKEDKENKK